MKNILSIVFVVALALSNIPGFCQYSNLEFTENKGQWDGRVKYRGQLNNGAFFLENKGFRVLQHNAEDLKNVAEYYHADKPLTQSNSSSKSSSLPQNSTVAEVIRSHAYEVQFVNAGNPVIVADKPLIAYNNYLVGKDPTKWATNCKIFQAVNYTNMYPGVDVRYYTNEGKLKYDIIVKPGADLTKIALKYDGVDGLQVKNEELIIKTSVGEFKELAPYAYQVINGVKQEVGCRFKVTGKTVQFTLSNYAKDAVLVIDPTLVFSTFTGSKVDNWGFTATYGPDGTFYSGGIVFGSGFPTTTGAFQTSFAGGTTDSENIGLYDIGIMKFAADGASQVYATYIGGGGNDIPQSLIVDDQGNLVIAGRTNSTNYPTTAPNIGPGGDFDIIITKLNAAGSGLIGSRKIGGTKLDGVNIRPKYQSPRGLESLRRNYGDDSRSEVILDGSNNIYLASSTQSVDFPVTAGSFQTTLGGSIGDARRQDGVVMKFSPNVSNVLFSTFIGGNNDDAAFVLAINPTDGNIYVGGNTVSSNLPGNSAGALYPNYQGGDCDGFIAILNPTGTTIVKKTYIGTGAADMLYGIQFDKFGYPYIMGTTTSGAWPVLNAPFRQAGGKQYIAKLQPDLSSYAYSTVFGAPSSDLPNISPVAFLVDQCENVYVSGWGGQLNNVSGAIYPNSPMNGLTITPDALPYPDNPNSSGAPNPDGSDFYFFVLEKNATKQLYGSFFGQFSTTGGGEHVDGGTSRFDKQGVIYQAMCANCGGGSNFPTTPGAWAETNGSTSCNLAAVKIAFNFAGLFSSVRTSINGVPRDTSGCVPLTVDFTDTLAQGKQYIWNFGDGSPDVMTTIASTSHTFNNIGTFSVRLISIDSAICNIADTAYTTIRVRNDEAKLGFVSAKLPPCESTAYQFTNTSVAPPGKPFSNVSFRWNFGDNTAPLITGPQTVTHNYASGGTYKVSLTLIDTSYCNSLDSVVQTIRISPNVKANFSTPPSGCAPYNARFNNTSAGGQQFFWNFGDGTTSTQADPTHLYTTPGIYSVSLTAIDSATCNIIDSTRFTLTVSSKPTSSFTYAPNPPQENTPVVFTNTSVGATNYKWRFGDGDSLLTASAASVSHLFNETQKYTTCLIAINQFGCPDTSCQDIQAKTIPLLDVPNAFTPNRDNINDQVFVRGFGISKMNWRIYNRWGTLIYQSSDRKSGWDGTYKGVMQPKEVYTYILDVQFSDGTNYQKKGDITLL